MADRFHRSDIGSTIQGFKLGLRASIAIDIVKHAALVTGRIDGEDTAGRQRLALMDPLDVANRAADIAGALVDTFEQREWIAPVAATPEEEWALVGELNRLRANREYRSAREELGMKEFGTKA